MTDRGHYISPKGKSFHLLLLGVQFDLLAKDLIVPFQTCELSRPLDTCFRAVGIQPLASSPLLLHPAPQENLIVCEK